MWQVLMKSMLICIEIWGLMKKIYRTPWAKYCIGDPAGLYPYGMDPDKSLYNYGVVL